jgi:zinc protease
MVMENQRARYFGFKEDEMDRAKKATLNIFGMFNRERDKMNSNADVAEYVRNFMTGEPILGIAKEFEFANEFIPNITLDEINQFIKKAIPPAGSKLIVYIGSSKELVTPTEEQLLNAVQLGETALVTPREQKVYGSTLMDTTPKAGSILSQTEDKALGITTLILSNGVKVVLKPTDFQNDQVLLQAQRFGGQSLYEEKDKYNALLAGIVANQMGVGNLSHFALLDFFARKPINLSLGFGTYVDGVNGSSPAADVETLMQLFYLGSTNARKDPEAFKRQMKWAIADAQKRFAKPEASFNYWHDKNLFDNHPRWFSIPTQEAFEKVEMDRTLEMHRGRFASAKGLVFVIVGSFDIEKIKPLIATYIASVPTPDIPLQYRDLGIRPIKGIVQKEMFAGSEAKSLVKISFTADAGYSQIESERLAVLTDILTLKIQDVLREKLTLIYSGGASSSLGRPMYPFSKVDITLPCAPENVEKVIAALLIEIDELKKNGPQIEDLNKVKLQRKQAFERDLKTNRFWMNKLSDINLYGDDPSSLLGYDERIQTFTPEQIRTAARKYLDTKNRLQSVLYPEKN